jgi:phage repressor protein C with HTH and peptisase S24 domain
MEKSVTQKLQKIIQSKGLSWEAAALQSGLERSYFRKLFERGGASPRGKTLEKIAKGLDISISELFEDSAANSNEDTSASVKNDVRSASATLPLPMDMAKDVPVMGTAAGSHLRGAFQLSADPVDYVRRPQTLMNARYVYSRYVEGTSMEPQYAPGDLVYIHPDKPARFGDAVVVQCQLSAEGQFEATIGILSKRSGDSITIRKHNPPAEIEISKDTIVAVHKVLSMNEIYGV